MLYRSPPTIRAFLRQNPGVHVVETDAGSVRVASTWTSFWVHPAREGVIVEDGAYKRRHSLESIRRPAVLSSH